MKNLDYFIETCDERQLWGNEKYGNKDINRDKIEDVIEELADVTNILKNRLQYQLIEKFGYIGRDVYNQISVVLVGVENLIQEVERLENELIQEYNNEYAKIIDNDTTERI